MPALKVEDKVIKVEDKVVKIEDKVVKVEDKVFKIEDKTIDVNVEVPQITVPEVQVNVPTIPDVGVNVSSAVNEINQALTKQVSASVNVGGSIPVAITGATSAVQSAIKGELADLASKITDIVKAEIEKTLAEQVRSEINNLTE